MATGRIFVAATLLMGHLALCMCPASAAEATVEPVGASCCGHAEAAESKSCCEDGDCARNAVNDPGQDPVTTVPSADQSNFAPTLVASTATELNWRAYGASALPRSAVSTLHSTPATLLFCVLTQ